MRSWSILENVPSGLTKTLYCFISLCNPKVRTRRTSSVPAGHYIRHVPSQEIRLESNVRSLKIQDSTGRQSIELLLFRVYILLWLDNNSYSSDY